MPSSEDRRRRVSSSVRSLLGSKGKRYNDILALMQQSSKNLDTGGSEAEESGSRDHSLLQPSPSTNSLSENTVTASTDTASSSTPPSTSAGDSYQADVSPSKDKTDPAVRTAASTRLPNVEDPRPTSSVSAKQESESLSGSTNNYTPRSETTSSHLIKLQSRGERVLKREYAPTMKHVVSTHKVSITLANNLLKTMETSLEQRQESESTNLDTVSRKFSKDQLHYHLKLALEAEGREWLLNFIFGVLDGNGEDEV